MSKNGKTIKTKREGALYVPEYYMKRTVICLLVVVLCCCAVCAVACETLPENAVKVTAENLKDWFDVYVDYEHDGEDYSEVHLKAAFAPKFTLAECTVVVTYEHEAEWDTFSKYRVVSGTQTLELQASATVSKTVSGAYGNRQLDVKAGTNTIAITKVEGHVVKAAKQWQRLTYSEENGTVLAQKLAAFQAAFDSSSAVVVRENSSKSRTNVFGDTIGGASNFELRYSRTTEDICTINGRVNQGEGYFASGDGVVREVLSEGTVSIFNDSTAEEVKALRNKYSKNLIVYAEGDNLGSVAQIDENRFVSKHTLDKIRWYAEDISWSIGDFNKALFDVENAYTFDASGKKLQVTQKFSLCSRQMETKSYVISSTTTYEIVEKHVRLVDEYPISAQDSAQQALDNFVPLEVDGTAEFTVPLSKSNKTEQWFTMNVQRGLYTISSNVGRAVQLFQVDGTTRVDTREYNELDGLYLACMKFSDRPDEVVVQVTKAAVETYPNYDNPTVVGSDGKMQGAVECYGDAVVFEFVVEDEGLYELSCNENDNIVEMSFVLGEKESCVYPHSHKTLLKLAKGEYVVTISTNNKNSAAFDFDLTLVKSAVQETNYVLTETAQEITLLQFQAVCCDGMGGSKATFTVAEGGKYRIVTTPQKEMDGYVLLYDGNGEYVSRVYGTDYYTLTDGTYTVEYSSNVFEGGLQKTITSWYEKVD